MTNPICVYDFTIPFDRVDLKELINKLNKHSKKWAFQQEVGASGYDHWQGRLSLKVKKRRDEVIALWNLKATRFSPTSNANKKNDFYVLKEDTRVDGPYLSTDYEEIYIPRQIREISGLYPWQAKVIELSKVWDTRHIDLIVDPVGNVGKSILKGWMRSYRTGRVLPYANNYKDLLRMVCDMPTSTCYVIDMPKAIDKEKLGSLYSAIETIKDGYAYDDRYKFTEKVFDCPNIWIFTNVVPDMSYMSQDRWRFWSIVNKKLVPYEEPCFVI